MNRPVIISCRTRLTVAASRRPASPGGPIPTDAFLRLGELACQIKNIIDALSVAFGLTVPITRQNTVAQRVTRRFFAIGYSWEKSGTCPSDLLHWLHAGRDVAGSRTNARIMTDRVILKRVSWRLAERFQDMGQNTYPICLIDAHYLQKLLDPDVSNAARLTAINGGAEFC